MVRAITRTAVALALLGLLATGLGACSGTDEREEARRAATAFLTAWSAGQTGRAARATDAPGPAQALLDEVSGDLSAGRVRTRLGAVSAPQDGRATARFQVRMALRTLGVWSYSSRLPLARVRQGDRQRWVVDWAPRIVHPRLTRATRLSRSRDLPERAPVLDRNGDPLMRERPVVGIGVEPRRLTEPDRAYAALARLGVDPAGLEARVSAAPPDQFVDAITLRAQQFDEAEGRLRSVPGLVFREGTLTLAPTPTFGRALLGTVRPATRETLKKAGPLASPVDTVGSSGLQLAFQARLAGRPSGQVRLVRRADDRLVAVLHRFAGAAGRPLATTLDRRTQGAAEHALATVAGPAALVAVQPSSGEVLAAANAPADSSFDRALVGRYPPGSTFKVVSAAALLRDGLRPDDVVACPTSVTVAGKRFENYDTLGALGRVPFSRDFAMSCNTAFIGATRRLPRGAIAATARRFGVGDDWRLGLDSFSGSVPAAASAVEQAADTIGQGKVVMSPLAMAMVAAAVADGTPRTPTLLADAAPAPTRLPVLPGDVARTLRSLMREIVATGTARVIDLPGAPVGGKTGTAEFGTDDPPKTHAWMVGFRNDLAFAVLVERGESGSHTAGPVARVFLQDVT